MTPLELDLDMLQERHLFPQDCPQLGVERGGVEGAGGVATMAFVGIPVRQFMRRREPALAKALKRPSKSDNFLHRLKQSVLADALLAAAEHECVVDLVPRALHSMRQPRDDAPQLASLAAAS